MVQNWSLTVIQQEYQAPESFLVQDMEHVYVCCLTRSTVRCVERYSGKAAAASDDIPAT